MHTGSTHFSDVGKGRLQPLTNEPVRAEHGGWLHTESIRPCFYNLTITSLKRQQYEGLTASCSPTRALLWNGRTRPFTLILPKSTQLLKDHSRELKSSVCVIFLKCHCIETLPYCITRRRLWVFRTATMNGYSFSKTWQLTGTTVGSSTPQLKY